MNNASDTCVNTHRPGVLEMERPRGRQGEGAAQLSWMLGLNWWPTIGAGSELGALQCFLGTIRGNDTHPGRPRAQMDPPPSWPVPTCCRHVAQHRVLRPRQLCGTGTGQVMEVEERRAAQPKDYHRKKAWLCWGSKCFNSLHSCPQPGCWGRGAAMPQCIEVNNKQSHATAQPRSGSPHSPSFARY